MQLILFIGIPASGKSSFYKEHFFNTHMRISLDLLNTRNKADRFLDLAFSLQQRVVIDNTNVSRLERDQYIHRAKANRYSVVGYWFESELQDCLYRNEHRAERDRIERVGVMAKFKRLELPSFDEGFDELYFVKIAENTFTINNLES